MGMICLEGVDLLEQIKITLVAAFECLVGLLAPVHLDSTLRNMVVSIVRSARKSVRTSRRHEFLVALREFQWSSCAGPISHWNSWVFSSSVQCLAPAPPASSYGSTESSASRRRFETCPVRILSVCWRFLDELDCPGCPLTDVKASAAVPWAELPCVGGDWDWEMRYASGGCWRLYDPLI
jgi:hypothetical protein